jgi:hypothetical protein
MSFGRIAWEMKSEILFNYANCKTERNDDVAMRQSCMFILSIRQVPLFRYWVRNVWIKIELENGKKVKDAAFSAVYAGSECHTISHNC